MTSFRFKIFGWSVAKWYLWPIDSELKFEKGTGLDSGQLDGRTDELKISLFWLFSYCNGLTNRLLSGALGFSSYTFCGLIEYLLKLVEFQRDMFLRSPHHIHFFQK